MRRIESTYLNDVMDIKKLKKVVREVTKILKPYAHEFDAIAFRGMSGATFVPILALRLDKDIIMVRKPIDEEDSHSSMSVEGRRDPVRYLIVDDLVGMGATVRNIIQEIKDFSPKSECVGVFTYLKDYGRSTSTVRFGNNSLVDWNERLGYRK